MFRAKRIHLEADPDEMADSGAGYYIHEAAHFSFNFKPDCIEVKVEMAVQHRWSVGATIKSAAETEKPYDMTHLTVLERDFEKPG
jgi:hypothetical protein